MDVLPIYEQTKNKMTPYTNINFRFITEKPKLLSHAFKRLQAWIRL